MSSTPWEGIEQPSDDATAGSPWFYIQTYEIYQDGLISLLKELNKYIEIADELGIAASPFKKEIDRVKQMIEWGDERLKVAHGSHGGKYDTISLSQVSYGSLRYLKAGVLLLVRKQMEKRAEIINKKKRLPYSLLQAFDEKITQLQNISEMGKLNGLKPADIFFEIASPDVEMSVSKTETQIVNTELSKIETCEIQIIDSILRERCLNLFRSLETSGSQKRLDTIVREMSVILEDRVRQLSGIQGKSGMDLMSAAFSSEPIILKFSEDPELQKSAHLLFRGYSGFVRNEVMHKLVPSYNKDRVLQLMGFIDYLLFLLSRAERKAD